MQKICPYYKHDILHITQWLNEQSVYGWELKSWGKLFCKFEEYNGPRYHYQIDMDNWEDEANVERRYELEALGWEYVETIAFTRLHIYRSLDRKASIPKNEEFCKFNRKKLRGTMFGSIAGFILSLVTLLLVPLSKMPFLFVELTQTDRVLLLISGIWLGVLSLELLNRVRHDYRLYKLLGKSFAITIIDTEGVASGTSIRLFLEMLKWTFLIGALIFYLWMGNAEDRRNLPEADTTTKYVDLWKFQEEGFKISETILPDEPEINRANCIRYRNGAFVEEYYQVSQSGYGTLDEAVSLAGYYWIDVSENVQEKLFFQIVERYASYSDYYGHNLFRKDKYDSRDQWVITEQEDERFTKLIIAEGINDRQEVQLIFAQKQNDIVYLRCNGKIDCSILIEELAINFEI